MKHILTYNNYQLSNNSLNEGFFGDMFKKATSFITNWKNKKQKEALKTFYKKFQEKKDDPKLQDALSKLKDAMLKISDDDKKKLKTFVDKGEVPTVANESLFSSKNFNVRQILSNLSLSVSVTSFVSLLIVVIKIVMDDSGSGMTSLGISYGTLGAILMATTVVSGLLTGYDKDK